MDVRAAFVFEIVGEVSLSHQLQDLGMPMLPESGAATKPRTCHERLAA